MLYDPFFKKLFNGDEHRQRLSRLVSSIIGQEVTVIDILPSESSSFEDSFIIMDMIVHCLTEVLPILRSKDSLTVSG